MFFFLKVFEYCILPILKSYTQISPLQFGYRPNTSTLIATTIFKEIVNTFLEDDSVVYACFLDLSKVFERIDHSILIRKLLRDKVPSYLVNILSSIFMKSKVCVHFNGSFSNSWQIKQGVRQGRILSAYFFTYYIDDILKRVFSEDIGCCIGVNKFNVLAYADDIVLISPSAGGLRFLMNIFNDSVGVHRLYLNVNKTKIMVFRNKKKKVFNDIPFFMNGVKLENVACFKYLGCVLKWDLDDSDDILKCLSAFNRSFGFLYRKFYSVNIEILFSLFLSFCLSFYGAELWFYRSDCKEAFNKMAVSYHCALKKILGVPKFYSNHLTCSVLGAFTFNHFVNIKIT